MKNLNLEVLTKLNQILPCKTRQLKKACRQATFGHCIPSKGNTIYIRLKMAKFEYLEMTWVHEWMHLYQASKDRNYKYSSMRNAKPVGNPPAGVGCADMNQMEEECEAFALLMVGKSKEYDLRQPETSLWLSRMWLNFWDKYPELRPILRESH